MADGNLEMDQMPAADAHACCQTANDQSNDQTDLPTDEDCPHESLKQSQISDATASVQHGLSDPLNQSSDYYEITPAFAELGLSLYSPSKALANFTNSPPGNSVSRAYCVYLL